MDDEIRKNSTLTFTPFYRNYDGILFYVHSSTSLEIDCITNVYHNIEDKIETYYYYLNTI